MGKIYELGLADLDLLFSELDLNGIFLLRGNLAAGKTTLVKHLAKCLNIKGDITSPTFSIMQSYKDGFYHYDIYQSKLQGFMASGLYENLNKKGLHLVEWGDGEFEKMLENMGFSYTCIDISNSKDNNKRIYKVSFHA